MSRTGRKLKLNDEDQKTLVATSRAHSADHRAVMRSKIILMLNEGYSYDSIKAELKVGREAISKWKKRYLESGLDGLKDAPRPGKTAIYTEEDKARVIQKACSKPEGGYSNWSQRRIAKEFGMSQSTVQNILKSHDLKPHKVECWCGKSTDPEFEEKMLNVVGLYMNPPENALVLSVDEKTQIQALDRSQPELPLRPGSAKRLTATYKRHGTGSLIAALSVHDGEITADTIDKNNAQNFLRFLKKIHRKYPKKQLHVIADNLNVHKHKDVKEWVDSKQRMTIHFTPTYSSWLNQIEIWFNIMSKDVLKGAV
ncbi:IS630 family transposase [Marinifilum sp.]|uniref:IS630 family transposase n=1 Tax=Marinifilum sp. TaxID=2033137 RepID=UPI003BACF2AF